MRPATLESLQTYLTSRGAEFRGLEPAELGGSWGVGLRARRNFAPLEVSATVPRRECVLASECRYDLDDATARCAAELLARRTKEPDHPWYNLLFDATDLRTQPLVWPNDVFEERVRGLSIAPTLRRRRRIAAETADSLHVDPEAMLRAYALVASRAYWISTDLALAPLIDLANHHESGAYVDAGDGVFADSHDITIVAAGPVQTGDQFFSTYLPHPSNVDTFASFGFVNDSTDVISLDLDYHQYTVALRIKRKHDSSTSLNLNDGGATNGDVLVIADDDSDDLDIETPRLAFTDFVADLATKPTAVTTAFFSRLLDAIPSSSDDDDTDYRLSTPDIAAMLAVLRREEILAVTAVRDEVLRRRRDVSYEC